jgi:hypothetical protein
LLVEVAVEETELLGLTVEQELVVIGARYLVNLLVV